MAKNKSENTKVETEAKAEVKTEVKERKSVWRRNKSSKKSLEENENKPEVCSATNQHLGNLPLEGLTYKTCLTDKYLQRPKYNPHEAGTVYSKIPGTIKSIAVKTEQYVKEGELLCILDAMKMNNEILAPCEGTIIEINIKPGQVIAKDVLLFKISSENLQSDVETDDTYLEEEMMQA
ncbi:MAG: acetyl-CoA carboxylase biotin carboxyl carrier protein subunit [Bacteroidales bacterium]|jgi:biotin carboxyl carrier protein|nr:acetyl-CoA carboxylase biotin carboxyl carrier protein subunit [Bacteroidales bacterium]